MSNKLNKLREEARKHYKNIGQIYCPYFQEKITFNSEGFNHIRYKGNRKQRHHKVQEIRYKLLNLAPEVVNNSKTLQEFDQQKQFIEFKHNKRKEKQLKTVSYYGFIAIINNRKIKVIIRQIGEGSKHFWSIIPNWTTRRKSDKKPKYINHTGNLYED